MITNPTAEEVVSTLGVLQGFSEFRPNQPPYEYRGRVLKWGEDMPPGCMESMRAESEVVLLLGADARPYGYLMVDQYGQVRERRVT